MGHGHFLTVFVEINVLISCVNIQNCIYIKVLIPPVRKFRSYSFFFWHSLFTCFCVFFWGKRIFLFQIMWIKQNKLLYKLKRNAFGNLFHEIVQKIMCRIENIIIMFVFLTQFQKSLTVNNTD